VGVVEVEVVAAEVEGAGGEGDRAALSEPVKIVVGDDCDWA
jgi:hypothetical protein